MKALTALREAAVLLQDDTRSDDAVLGDIAQRLPGALQSPADAAALVSWGDIVHRTAGWRETPWLLRSAFRTADGRQGAVAVAYLRELWPRAAGPFLADERYLVDSVASMIAATLDRRQTARDLGERVKELEALHATAALLQDDSRPDEEVLERLAGLLPAAFQYPADTVARVVRGDELHASPGWTETPWLLRSTFRMVDGREGAIEVCYLRERPREAEGPFLAQERRLLDSVAAMLATSLDRRWDNEHLQHLVERGLVRLFHWDVQSDHFIWPTLTVEAAGAVSPLSLTRAETNRFVHPEDQDAVTQRVNEVLADPSRDSFTAEYRVSIVPGQYSWRQLLAHVIRGADGRAVRVIGTSFDNDEHKSMEAQLRQAVKMEALGQLAGGVAHDLNNMLAVMLGRLQLALGRIDATDPVHRHLQEMAKAGNSAVTLTRQILAFGRRQELRPRKLDLGVAIADMKGMLQSLLTRHIDLVVDSSPGAPAAMVDPNQFQQVVLNLCVNARDAMAKGGSVTLRVRRAFERPPRRDLTRGEPQEWTALEVEDTGTGIPPEVRDHIFEPFFTTKAEGQGTGLGLSTVHGIVVQSGGFLEVDTEVGRGTRFVVYFPTADRPTPAVTF